MPDHELDADVAALIEFLFVWTLLLGGCYCVLAIVDGWWPFS